MPIKITKYDKLLRKLLISKRGSTCERCGKQFGAATRGLHTSHYFGRSNWTVRLDLDNVSLHCYGCHAHLSANPHYHYQWKLNKLGTPAYLSLVTRASSGAKLDKDKWYLENLHE